MREFPQIFPFTLPMMPTFLIVCIFWTNKSRIVFLINSLILLDSNETAIFRDIMIIFSGDFRWDGILFLLSVVSFLVKFPYVFKYRPMGARWHARGCLVLSADWLSRNLQRSLQSYTIRALSGSTHTCLRSWERSTSHVLPGYIYKDHALDCDSRYPCDLGIRSVTF